MVHNSEVVLLGRILAIDGEREQLGQATYKIRLEVEEVLKGSDREHEYFYLFAERKQIEAWIKSRARLVLNSPFPFNVSANSESAWVMIDFAEPSLMQLSLGDDVCSLLSIRRGMCSRFYARRRTIAGRCADADLSVADRTPLGQTSEP